MFQVEFKDRVKILRTLARWGCWLFRGLFLIGFSNGTSPVPGLYAEEPAKIVWELVQAWPAEEARQAAAANEQYLFAITNSQIGKYDRATGKRIAVSVGEANHLNSGFFWQGRLLAAHSNYPAVPESSQIMQLDVDTMELTLFHDFKDYGGSLTWVLYKDGYWWCHFAKYGAENHRSFLVKFTDDWQEVCRWTLPKNLVDELGKYSLSGGVWMEDLLYVTGHDAKAIYRLRVPASGNVLAWVDSESAPFSGQGIALDPVQPNTLIGIDRAKQSLLIAVRKQRDKVEERIR
jgi:hypothetical protein